MNIQLMFILMDLFTIAIIPIAFLIKMMHEFKKGLRVIQDPDDRFSCSECAPLFSAYEYGSWIFHSWLP